MNKLKSMLLLEIRKLLSYYKRYLFVFFVIFLIFFITGIMTCTDYSSSVSHEHLINKYLAQYLTKESTYVGFFLILSAYFLIINLFVIMFTRNTFLVVVDIIIFSLMSYVFGFDICIIVLNFGIAGVVFGILVLGLMHLIVFLIMMLIFSIAIKRWKDYKKSCENIQKNFYIRIYLALIVLGVLSIFVMSICFGVIHIFVIVD